MQATVLVPMTFSVRADRARSAASPRPAASACEREVDARRDHAAAVIAVVVDHVEGRRGAEIDDDQRPAIAVMRRDGVDEAVGADLLGPVDQRLDAELDAGLADDQRRRCAIVAAETGAG